MQKLTQAQQALAEQHIPLARYFAAKYAQFADFEDILQCAYVGLCKAARSYNAEQAAFATFAAPCIGNEISGYFRKKQHSGHERLEPLSLDETIHEKDSDHGARERYELIDSKVHVEEAAINMVEAQAILRRFQCRRITEKQRAILRLRLAGLNQPEIAEYLGVSQAHVSRTLKRVITHAGLEWKARLNYHAS